MVLSKGDVSAVFRRASSGPQQPIGSTNCIRWLGSALVSAIISSWINLLYFHPAVVHETLHFAPRVPNTGVHSTFNVSANESDLVMPVMEMNTTAFENTFLDSPGSTLPSFDRKPRFVFHIGPPKTGSTTIQCGLSKYSKLLADLDHLYFVGAACGVTAETMVRKKLGNGETTMLGGIVHSMLGKEYGDQKDPFDELKERIDYHYPLGNSIVFSVEGLSRWLPDRPDIWEKLQSLFADSPYEVEVVVYYRNYSDWLPSMYYQANQANPEFRYPKWGNQHESFRTFLEQHMLYFNHTLTLDSGEKFDQSLGDHMTIRSYESWSQHFNVSVVSLHDEGDIVNNFLCRGTSVAPNSCRYLQSNPNFVHSTTKRVAADNFDAVRTAEKAWQLGIVPSSASISGVIGVVRHLFYVRNTSLPSLYTVCLPQSLASQFANASLTFHEKYLNLVNPSLSLSAVNAALEEHMAKFEDVRAKGKFCQIDPVLALSDVSLRKALEQFSNETTNRERNP